MNQTYSLHEDTARRLYLAAMIYPDPDVRAAAKTLKAQNPDLLM